MTELGVLTSEFPRPDFAAVLQAVKGQRISTVQLQPGSLFPDLPIRDALLFGLECTGDRLEVGLAERTSDACRQQQIRMAAIDGTYNMAAPDRDRRFRNLGRLTKVVELAPAFGTEVVTLCTGSRSEVMWQGHPDNGSDRAWDDLVEQLTSVCPVAEAHGITLAFEPEHNNVVDSAERARRLIDQLGSPALKVVMDPANLFHTGELADQDDHLRRAFRLLGPDIALAHAKDLDHDGDAGGRAAGRGLLNYPLLLAELQRCGFDGAIILHQLSELGAEEIDSAFDHVRSAAPPGYLAG